MQIKRLFVHEWKTLTLVRRVALFLFKTVVASPYLRVRRQGLALSFGPNWFLALIIREIQFVLLFVFFFLLLLTDVSF